MASLTLRYTKGVSQHVLTSGFAFPGKGKQGGGVVGHFCMPWPQSAKTLKTITLLITDTNLCLPFSSGADSPGSTEQQFLPGPILQLLTPLRSSKPYELSGILLG